MKEFTDKVTNKVKEQLEQVSGSVAQVLSAGRGLYFKLSETGTKQFDELVKVGEAKKESGQTLVGHVKESFQDIDPKTSATHLRFAALGLLNKTLENSEKVFSDLVKYGEDKNKPETSSSTKSTSEKKKSGTKAA